MKRIARVSVSIATVALLTSACSGATGPTHTSTVTVHQTTTVTASPAVAPSAPLSPESCGPIAHAADGNVSPALCPDGHPNAAAIAALTSISPLVLSLGADAGSQVVQFALCVDSQHSTNPIEETAYTVAAAENAWQFGIDPTSVLVNDLCPQVLQEGP